MRQCQKCKRCLPLNAFAGKTWCRRCCGRQSKRLKKMYARRLAKHGTTKSRKRRPKLGSMETLVIANSCHGESYGSRNTNLAMMGFITYAKYLKSALWERIRKKVFAQKGKHCSLCPQDATIIHHNRYHLEDLTGTTTEHLWPLCEECHGFLEFGPGNAKKPLHEAKATFLRMQETWFDFCANL